VHTLLILLTLRPGVEEFSRIRCRLVHLSSPATWPSSPTVGTTIERRVAAIRSVHKAAGHEPPTNAEGVKAVKHGRGLSYKAEAS
jgi:hypothetical protein